MDVLHYSFSLSACPKCHLLVCKHTSLANLDFRSIEQDEEEERNKKPASHTHSNNVKIRYQRLSTHGMNFYVLPSTTASDNRHSWTTFGTGSIGSTNTMENSSIGNDTLCDNIPFADENIVHSFLPIKPRLNQIVRTQSERCQKNFKPRISLTKSYSFSTIYTTPKSNKSLTLSPHIQQDINQSKIFYSNLSIFVLSILILSYLITNTLDIVLLYIYYHTTDLYFLIFIFIIFTGDFLLWINNLIDRKNLSTRLLFIPCALRFHILYELVELIIIRFNTINIDKTKAFHSSSSSSTTTTLETNISDSSLIHQQQQQQQQQIPSYKIKKRRLFHYLTLFYLIHSSLLVLINLYFWSNHFQISTKSTLNMEYFIPQWTTNNHLLLPTSMNIIPIRPSISYWSQLDKQNPRRTMSLDWTRPKFYHQIPLSIRLPSSSTFVLLSIFYHLIINYCLLSALLNLKRTSLMIIVSLLSRFCLIMTRIYTIIFIFRLHAWWFTITFLLVHLSLMFTLLIDRSNFQEISKRIFLKLIFSFLTPSSINDLSINVLISLENISIFIHRLYLETSSSHNETTLRFIIFLSILISLQIIGFLFDILSKHVLYRSETTEQTITKV